MTYVSARRRGANDDMNRLYVEDRAVHEWYRFVLSFPPHLVRDYVHRFDLPPGARVLDPFCGTGTTLVECKKLGIEGVGIEANPMAHFASTVKTDWTPCPDGLVRHARAVGQAAEAALRGDGVSDESFASVDPGTYPTLRSLPPEQMDLLLADSISPLPLHKALVLLDVLRRDGDARFLGHELLALAKAVVFAGSNLHFGPEVGVGPAKRDAPVIGPWLAGVGAMAADLRCFSGKGRPASQIHRADARAALRVLEPGSIDAVVTSPPYPNEKDYTRTTRLESVLLGFVQDKAQFRVLKQQLLRSNTRGVYKEDDDDTWAAQYPEVGRIANAIEARRIELGKTSGFERMYARVTKLYFGGMARHLADLRPALRPGARLAYVVGDQASYLRVMIRTGQLLADIAQSLGYEVSSIDLFRTRRATATRDQLREEVVVLRWPGLPTSRCCLDRQRGSAETDIA